MRLYLVLFVGLFAFSACDQDVSTESLNPGPFYPSMEDLSEEIIFVRESDIEVSPAYAWDMHTEGKLSYTEGAILGLLGEDRFFLNGERFYSSISYGCTNSKVNGLEMCNPGHIKCNYQEYFNNGAWAVSGAVQKPGNFEWEFIDLKKAKRFILKFDDLPVPTKITDYNTSLHIDKLNVVHFRKNDESDSIFFQLVVLPKSNLDPINPRRSSASSYPILPKGNRFEIEGKDLFPNAQSIPTEQDSVFINLVTVKRIIKEVNDTLFGFTYYVNDPKPVNLSF